jgi:hypothetical protein
MGQCATVADGADSGSGGSGADNAAVGEVLKRSLAIDDQLRAIDERERRAKKLLLLGTAESGKSTMFRQMKLLHGDGFSDEDRALYRPTMLSNVLQAAQQIVLVMQVSYKVSEVPAHLHAPIREIMAQQPLTNAGLTFILRNASMLLQFISDPFIQGALSQVHRAAAKVRCFSSITYLLNVDNVKRIIGEFAAAGEEKKETVNVSALTAVDCGAHYMPNVDDILRCRVPTQGMTVYKRCQTDVRVCVSHVIVRLHLGRVLALCRYSHSSNRKFPSPSLVLHRLSQRGASRRAAFSLPLQPAK